MPRYDMLSADVQELIDNLHESRRIGDRIEEGWAIANIGRYHRINEQAVEATIQLNEAARIFQEIRFLEGIAWVMREFGNTLLLERRFDEAEQMFQDALAMHQQLNLLDEQAADLIILGTRARWKKQYDLAATLLTQAYELAQEANDALRSAYALHEAGIVEDWRGNNGLAFIQMERALPYYRKTDDKVSTAELLGDLGAVATDLRYFEESERYLSSAILAFEALSDKRAVAVCYLNFGRLHQANGDLDAARAATIKGATMLRDLNSPLPPFGQDLISELGLK